MLKRLLFGLALLLSTGCANEAPEVNVSSDRTPAEERQIQNATSTYIQNEDLPQPKTDSRLKVFVFPPPQVAGWTMGKQVEMPGKRPGVSVQYSLKPPGDSEVKQLASATLYQYTNQLPEISDSLNSAEMKIDIVEVSRQINAAVKMGIYAQPEDPSGVQFKDGVLPLGQSARRANFLECELQLNQRGLQKAGSKRPDDSLPKIPLVTTAWIWAQDNVFLQLRVSRHQDADEGTKEAIESLLTEIGLVSTRQKKAGDESSDESETGNDDNV